MTLFDAIAELKSLISSKYDYSNVGTITTNPAIKTRQEYLASSIDTSNGVLIIESSQGAVIEEYGDYRDERHILEVSIQYKDDEDVLESLLEELDRSFADWNDDIATNEHYSWDYSYDTNSSTGIIAVIVSILVRGVALPT